jgi:hypothetical protein
VPKSVTVSEWKQIKCIVSRDGERRMRVSLTPNGLFRFSEDTFVTEDPPAASMAPLRYWGHSRMSGLYASADDAEQAAYLELPWLRDEKSN